MWLDSNAFTGLVPDSLSKATALLKLHLEDNGFADSIPTLALSSLSSFNVSNNDLKGVIPDSYSKFNARSFLGNKVCVVRNWVTIFVEQRPTVKVKHVRGMEKERSLR
ncbi:hypothetical protein BHE74_00051092 [Ensete ventricosum]|nr:hypothetical protein GW17_00019733 [Ensete ventricosum]RWW43271.1 hypothetical protein BHE74_00051092 [Ensete ventricosum]RZS12894.1 hypothetical protein BHM03_00044396 [Ensete ventricosum]